MKNTIVFIYLGDKLPKYGIAALKLAKVTSGSNIHLIGNAIMLPQAMAAGAKFTPVESFYDETKFANAREYVSSDPTFRSGFWLKSMERLFVLEQFMSLNNLNEILHAELDQLIFDSSRLTQKLGNSPHKGIFFPFHNPNAVVASLLFVNDLSALQSLTQMAGSGESFNNEMDLLAKWSKTNPTSAFALPTLATEILGRNFIIPENIKCLKAQDIDGIVDAAQLGQWVAGIDPRNVPISEHPTSKFVDQDAPSLLNRNLLEELKFVLDSDKTGLSAEVKGHAFRLYNLHLHSKCHIAIWKSKNLLEELFNQSSTSKPMRISGMRKVQIASYFTKIFKAVAANPGRIRTEIQWRVKFKLDIRPSSKPFISGDTFRASSDFRWESNSKNVDIRKLSPGDVIFCESELFPELCSEVLELSSIPLVIVLGNSDKNHQKLDFEKAKIHPNSLIFAQNLCEPISGVQVLPIGLENAWRSNHGVLKLKEVLKSTTLNRKNRIMWSFNLATNPKARSQAKNELIKLDIADKIENVSPKKHRYLLGKYSFIASPPGNGLDTHRTWEAMYFKCVPIVTRSFMASTYESLGLPIWVVDSYSDLSKLDEGDLQSIYNSFAKRFESKAIWSEYWINKIEEASTAIKNMQTYRK